MLCVQMLDAQEVKTDSLWADSLVQTLPEVMVTGERPVVSWSMTYRASSRANPWTISTMP